MPTNPPIVIGPFANVPAPGSGVKSDWAQQISHWVTDQMPRGLKVRPAYVTVDQASVVAETDLTGLTNTITVEAGRWYEVSWLLCLIQNTAGNQNFYVTLDGVNAVVGAIGPMAAGQISMFGGSMTFTGGASIGGQPSIAAGAGKIVKMRGSGAGFQVRNTYVPGRLWVRDIGSTVAAP